MIKLSAAKVGQYFEICDFEKDRSLLRFYELGFVKGQKVKVISTSPLKKVFLLEISGYVLSVRRELLKEVFVK